MPENTIDRKYDEKTIEADYSRFLFIYDFWARLTEKKALNKVMELAEPCGEDEILEVAVGTGLLFKRIVSANQLGMNQGIDLSESMLGKAIGRMEKSGFNNYKLQLGNAMSLPFEDDKFDILVNNFMLDLLPEEDFPKIISEYKRVLKPGGRVVISTMAFGKKRANKFWGFLARKTPRLLAGCRPIAIERYLKNEFNDVSMVYLSQNTFPSEVLRGFKKIDSL
ncbi:MAG: methyltransferase domain-containing protein [Candidatus Heimdallarchaeota archaeon]|nr:methyltransferase domain-containing protein [Candidatus Heimdallarchaeota archaeon]